MEERLQISFENKSYDIVYANDFENLTDELAFLNTPKKKVCIVTDDKVAGLYQNIVYEILKKSFSEVIVFSFKNGEEQKNLDTIENLYATLIEHHFDRNDILAALGGGVVGDMCGYAAATYLRGIGFIQIPTTLLSQVDSSIGGKTGVDYKQYKNMIGAFHMPRLVYTNIATLKDLDDRQYYSGMGEVMKHALIRNEEYFEWIISSMYEIFDRDLDVLREMIYQSNLIKKEVVEKDPYEKNERALLNFGHTIGHAIEKYKNFSLSHGECVALGCVAAAFISWKRDMINADTYYEIRDMFVPFNLPISIDQTNAEDVYELTKSDKKMSADTIRFVLLEKIGKATIKTDVTKQEMIDAINEIIYNEDESND